MGNAAAAEPGLQILLPAPQPCPGITPPAQHGRTKEEEVEEEEKEEEEVVCEDVGNVRSLGVRCALMA